MAGASRLVVVASLSIAITFAFALFSWRWIEKPFLRLKKVLLPPRPAPVAPSFPDAGLAPRLGA